MLSFKKNIFLLLSLLICTQTYSQKPYFQKTDSILKADATATEWRVDSARTSKSKVLVIYQVPSDEYASYRYNKKDIVEATLGANAVFSNGDNAPFWLTNNQHGIGSIDKDKQYLRLKTLGYKALGEAENKLALQGGADILAANNLSSDFYVQQLYAELLYKAITFSVGMKEKNSLFKNTELSSGGLTLSNNARPIPQIKLALPKFVVIPGTDRKLLIMGGISYGWFLDDNFKHHNASDGYYADKVLYHRKYGFLKYKPNKTWDFIAGLEMDTQWGGHFYRKGEYWGRSSASLKDFFKVLLPMSGGSEGSHVTDAVNILGNVYGSMHLIGKYKNDNLSLKAYHEHFFEDHSGLIFKNIPDGLYGLEVHLNKTPWISEILFEYLHTKDQSGPFLWDKSEEIPTQISGGDNSYNQIDYISLTNYGYVIGNPLLTSPIYNDGKSLTVYNTRLSSFHFGFAGNFSKNLRYRTLLTYSRSWGTPLIPSTSIRDQFSSLLEATYRNDKQLKGWSFGGAIAYDKSQIIGDNIGLQLKVSKTLDIP